MVANDVYFLATPGDIVPCRAGNTEQFCRPHQNGRMFSSCLCACFNRWRKPLVYSSSGSWCCSCVSSNARKTSTRCFFSVTRSPCSNSRTTGRYRAVFIGLQVFIFKWRLNVVLGVGESCLVFREFSSLRTHFRAAYCMRLLIACRPGSTLLSMPEVCPDEVCIIRRSLDECHSGVVTWPLRENFPPSHN